MAKRKYNPRSVTADQLEVKDDGNSNAEKIAEWCGGTATTVTNASGQEVPQVVVDTRTGTKVANLSDYVVELSDGNFTVLSERDFDEKYARQ